MMLHEPEEQGIADHQGRTMLDLPLLTRDDDTWEQFQGANIVGDTALRGEWKDDNTRALLWRLLLGVIPRDAPPSQWATEMTNKRAEYRNLVAEHRVDIAEVLHTTDPMAANPLFSGPGSGDDPWSHFYERKEMTETIKADLERLFPTGCGDHFLAPARQELLLSVLSLWADLNAATAYRQGMHEVLAPLILALEKEAAAAARADTSTGYSAAAAAAAASAAASAAEKVEKGDGATATARTTPWVGKSTVNGAPMDATTHSGAAATLGRGSTPQDLEADAFWLFSAVMKGLEGFYEHGTNNASSTRTREPAGERSGAGEGVDSPVVEMCKRLQGVRMREADPELQRHLAELDISPQLYGMKWARLMFGREFRVEAVLLLWDHIFASLWIEGRPDIPECIESVAVAMVVSIRDHLLGQDCTGCLQLLMRYPPDQSVSTVISLSLWVQALAASERLAEPQSSPAVTFGQEVPLERQLESARVRLHRAGREAGGVPVYSPSTSQSAAERRRSGSGAGVGRQSRPVGRDQTMESELETKNSWQLGLDDFTRRALSAAHGVAKLAVQTVERTQGGGDLTQQSRALPASEASALARRLRKACAAMEAGELSINVAAHEITEVARLLEAPSGGDSGREPAPARMDSHMEGAGGGGGGQSITRVFSTYSEDDGCADSLYTQDLSR